MRIPSLKKIFASLALSIVLFGAPAAMAQDSYRPSLSVNIPTVNFSQIQVQQADEEKGISGYIDVPWIAEYVLGVYRYGVSLAGIVAGVTIVIGGWYYMTGKAAEGKALIRRSLIGVVLVLGSYVILNAISPNLTSFRALRIKTVARLPFVEEPSGDSNDPLHPELAAAALGAASPETADLVAGIYCPGSGGSTVIPRIAASTGGRVAYRFGGKGGKPPFKETDPRYTKYNDNCPAGMLCLDCSGFVNYLLRCAGLQAPRGGTASIFGSGSEAVTTFSTSDFSVNGVALKPGDLVGYLPSESKLGIGHVFLYIGSGLVIESHGGVDGREGTNNPRETSLTKEFMEKHVKHVRRIGN